MDALVIALVYVVPFLIIGFAVRRLSDAWMDKKGVTLPELDALAGPKWRKGAQFLLGVWIPRTDRPED
jgi:hypothetical protein